MTKQRIIELKAAEVYKEKNELKELQQNEVLKQ